MTTSPTEPGLVAKRLTVTVNAGGRRLLNDVSLVVRPGRLTAVLGENGAGKSTLLACLGGQRPGHAGNVTLLGRPLAAWPARERAQRLAVLPQESRLAFGLTALEVALLGRSPHVRGRETAADLAIAQTALAAADAGHLAARRFPTLSGGERQRVMLARVLTQVWPTSVAAGSRFLLLDEPNSALDLAHQHGTMRALRGFLSTGLGVLAVLHDVNLAAAYADEVVVLRAGRVVCQGEPERVLTAETVADAFGLPMVAVAHPRTGRRLLVPVPPAD